MNVLNVQVTLRLTSFLNPKSENPAFQVPTLEPEWQHKRNTEFLLNFLFIFRPLVGTVQLETNWICIARFDFTHPFHVFNACNGYLAPSMWGMNITHHMSGLHRTDTIGNMQDISQTTWASKLHQYMHTERNDSWAFEKGGKLCRKRVKAYLKNRIPNMHLSGSKGRKYGTTTKAKCDAMPNTAALT